MQEPSLRRNGSRQIHVCPSQPAFVRPSTNHSIDRLRIFWGVLVSIAVTVLALILFRQFKPIHVTADSKPTLDFVSRAAISDAPIPDMAKKAIIETPTSSVSSIVEPSNAKPLLKDDERLRGFDEL